MKPSRRRMYALSLCLLFLLSGCGSQTVQSTVSESWTVDANSFAGSYAWAEERGGTVYALDTESVLHRWQAEDGAQLQTLSLQSFVAQYGPVQAVACGEAEIWAVLMQAEAAPTAELLHLDWDGAVLAQTTLSAEDLYPEEAEPLLAFNSVLALENGGAALSASQGLLTVDASGAVQALALPEAYIGGLCTGASGRRYCLTGTMELYELAEDGQPAAAPCAVLDDGTSRILSGSGNFELCILTDTGLFGWQSDSSGPVSVLDWSALSFTGAAVQNFFWLGETAFAVLLTDALSGSNLLLRYDAAADPVEKQLFTAGYLGDEPDELLSLCVQKYNLEHADSAFELVTYSDASRLKLALATGEGPDVIYQTASGGLSMEEYSPERTLLNLYTLMDGSDTLPREAFVENYLNCMEDDGALYYLSAGFCLSCCFSAQGRISEPEDLTATRLLSLAKSMEEPTVLAAVF